MNYFKQILVIDVLKFFKMISNKITERNIIIYKGAAFTGS